MFAYSVGSRALNPQGLEPRPSSFRVLGGAQGVLQFRVWGFGFRIHRHQ